MSGRLPNWQSRLQACLAERWARPFAWGTQDCALLAADCAQACTGVDPADELRGRYATARGAAGLLSARGGLAALAAERLGAEVPPAMAQPGDVGLVLSAGRECLAVCVGPVWVAPGAQGLVHLPPAEIRRAWRLP